MKYCKCCLYPETKPDLWFNEDGICSACISFENRKNINWKAKQKEFIDIIQTKNPRGNYDCVVPVSGGKDSTYQVIKVKQLGFNPLAVLS